VAVEIAPAVDDDLPGLIARFGPEQELYLRDRIRRSDLGSLLVARLDDEPVAIVYLRFAAAEEWQLRHWLPRTPVLSHLQVLAEYRRRGVATEIMAAAENFVRRRGRTRIALGVNLDNEVAYGLYRQLGYREWDREIINTFVEHFAPDGRKTYELEKCHIMVKELSPVPAAALP
jgi:ribosomal protein S18 acetylase RimI-like enzyme